MTKTFKILSAISFIALALALTFVGVWALTDLDFTVGGDITYTAPEQKLEGTKAEDIAYLTFVYDDTSMTAQLSACSADAPETIEIPENVVYNKKAYKVTDILLEEVWDEADWDYTYDSIFRNCANIKAITIPNSVTSIGGKVFYGCSSLTSITIPDSVTSIGSSAFYGCTGLTSITIPDSVTSIGDRVFYNCTGLTSITIPKSVTSIGSSAFYGCTGLTSISVNSGNSVYDSRNNCNSLIETATNTLIKGSNTSIIPSGITSIGSSAFYGCTGLTSITIPDSVTSIGGYAFAKCTGLTSITIPDSVTSIGLYAFQGCTSLTSTTIGNGVTSIGSSAFKDCTNLTYNTYDNAKYLGNETNPYVVLIKATSTSITSCTINSACKFIYNSAFYGCTGLTSITIPDSVTSIGQFVFYGCTNLAEVNVKATSVPTGGSSMFNSCSSSLVIYVPTASVDAYKAATYWSTYASQIQGKSF